MYHLLRKFMQIAVSYINSKFSLEKTIQMIASSQADFIHLDIMDGHYVENNNFDPQTLTLFQNISKPLDVHLMVENPEEYLKYFSNLPIYRLTFHPQTCSDIEKFITHLHELGIEAGIAINPNEEIEEFKDIIPIIDSILIMSVYPGKGGQAFIPQVLNKIPKLKKLKPNLIIGIDGGINDKTIQNCTNLDYVVSGSFICQGDNFDAQIAKLQN